MSLALGPSGLFRSSTYVPNEIEVICLVYTNCFSCKECLYEFIGANEQIDQLMVKYFCVRQKVCVIIPMG